MRISSGPINKGKVSVQVKTVLGQIRETLQIDPSEWLELLELTPKQYQSLLVPRAQVPLEVILRVAERYNLSLDSIFRNQIDFGVLAQRHQGNTSSIPGRYLPAAYSRTQTARVVFDFLEKKYGSFQTVAAARYLQISVQELIQKDQPINFQFYMDLFGYVHRSHRPKTGFYLEMGLHSTRVNKHGHLGTLFGSLESSQVVYEKMLGDLMPLFEKNNAYQIRKMNSEKALVRCDQNEEVASALKLRWIGSRHICEWKRGVFAGLPGYIGQPAASVRELKCVHRGDSHCLFEFDYSRRLSLN